MKNAVQVASQKGVEFYAQTYPHARTKLSERFGVEAKNLGRLLSEGDD
jgi:hypothetical protein